MPRINASPALMAEVEAAMTSTSATILNLSRRNNLEDAATVQELYHVLRTATGRVANLLNEDTQTHRLPPEVLTNIFDLVVNHGCDKHAKQLVPLTHVCQYWRTALLSYPRIWSTLRMKPGVPNVISEWLVRSQKVPLTIIAEFTDTFEHPPCRYQDSATATPADGDNTEVCPRHKAVLSLDTLFPHRSRIRDLNILFRSSDPEWDDDDHEDEPTLLYHRFFREALPNLQRLDFRALHVEDDRYMIPIPHSLFAKRLPRLKELKYLGVTGGLTGTAKDLVSCEIGYWSKSAGPTIIDADELRVLFKNNRTLESLIINECEFLDGSWGSASTPMPNLKFLRVDCPIGNNLEKILDLLQIPQFKDLNTVYLSLRFSSIEAVATDGSGHTFEFSRFIPDDMNFFPLRYLGADIITLRLDPAITFKRFDEGPALQNLLQSFETVQVLEFDGMGADCVHHVLAVVGTFPRLKIIRVTVTRRNYKKTLQLLAAVSKQRKEQGNPFTTIERLTPEGEDESEPRLRAKWMKRYIAEGIQGFLSE